MLKNYFTTAINNLLKNKLYSAINIIGLAVGLAACIIISIYVQHELSYDRQWEKGDLIYRVNGKVSDGTDGAYPWTSVLLLPALKKYFPEDIEFGTRIMSNNIEIQIGDKRYPASNTNVDEDFIKIFQAEELKGSLKSTLQSPHNIALSEESAVQYFGDKDPIGEMITLRDNNGNEQQYQVTAVYRFISPKTVLNIPCFSLLDDARLPEYFRKWYYGSLMTYVRLSETADIDKFVSRLTDFIDKTVDPNGMLVLKPGQKLSDRLTYSLQKMSDLYFNPLVTGQARAGNRTMVAVYTIISVLVLIIGCINFVILTTAKATQRAREVAMRKVVGARFKQLFIQFLGESLLITFMAFLISIAITEVALPFFETLMRLELTVPYTSPESYLFALLLITLVGISGGLYPAFVLSRFSPAKVLKSNQATDAVGSFKLRNILVIFQFSASIALIIATSVAFFQLLYANKRDPGFNPENLFIVYNIGNPDVSGHSKTLQEELLKLPDITNAALSSKTPSGGGWLRTWTLHPKKSQSNPQHQEIMVQEIDTGYDFFNTYKIALLSGRYFSREMDQPSPVPPPPGTPRDKNTPWGTHPIVINLAAAKQFGYASTDEAVGEIIVHEGYSQGILVQYIIVGVVEDSQYGNLRVEPEPAMYRLIPDRTFFLTVRYKGDYQKAVKEVERVWHEVVGDIPFNYSTVRQNMVTVFAREINENMLFIAFALLAVFIACMGLFGMAAFTVERRVKEIGVRKVMGAKVKDIVKLLGWNFLKPVLIANIIAWPVAIFAMQNWLERFPYRFHPLFMIPICLGSGLIALAIAWFTVAGNTTRVAKSKPIKALRYE